MKISIANHNITAAPNPIEPTLAEQMPSAAKPRAIWKFLATGFWAHTEDMSQTDTKPFEGLL